MLGPKGLSEGEKKETWERRGLESNGKKEGLDAAQAAWHCAASQQIWLVEAALLLGCLLLDGLGALGDSGALVGLTICIHGNGTESKGSGGHQRHQFLHLAVLLWTAII